MAVVKIHIEEFLELAKHHPVFDVRSPAEYFHAHIPGAYSLPLFTDEERRIVGTTYKQNSREDAIKIGLDFFGPKMRRMLEEAESIITSRKSATDNCVLVHCWRGGMRSAGVAWLLDLYGFKVYTLAGGYKAFRKYILETFNANYAFQILGGFTGSGKTFVLKELEARGENIIDLEAIACHRGSAFGAIGQPKQPSQEMFENLLATELRRSSADSPGDVEHRIWLEDESQRIGLVNIPQPVWQSMRKAPVYFLDISFEERLDNIIKCYGALDKEKMINAITRIGKRLGGLETKTAINFLIEDNVRESFRVLLKYYDKYYGKGLNNREGPELLIKTISCEGVDKKTNAEKVLQFEDASPVPKLFYD